MKSNKKKNNVRNLYMIVEDDNRKYVTSMDDFDEIDLMNELVIPTRYRKKEIEKEKELFRKKLKLAFS